MTKTILIGMNNSFSAKANRWLFSLTGLLFLANGIFNVYANSIEPVGFILGVLMILGGVYYCIYGLTAFSRSSRYALKVKMDDKVIELKNSFFKPAIRLKWADLQSIEFGAYEISFQMEGVRKIFSYHSNPNASIEIKKSIRAVAEARNIQIIGG